MIDITRMLVSLADVERAFANPAPGWNAWLMPLHLAVPPGAAGASTDMPAVLHLPPTPGMHLAVRALTTQLNTARVRIASPLVSFRCLRRLPADELPALARAAAAGQELRLPAATARSFPVVQGVFYALICAEQGLEPLNALQAVPACTPARRALLRWLGAAVGFSGLELNPTRRVELLPLQQAFELGEQFTLYPPPQLPRWLDDIQELPGRNLQEGLLGLAQQIEDALGLDMWFLDELEPPASDPNA